MRKSITVLFLLSLIFANVEAVAENYIVREDRVWVKNIEDGSTWREWFEGTTQINGKTYHDLHLRATYPDYTVEDVIAYMREEGGKVYSITANPVCDNRGASIFLNLRIAQTDQEALAYDFNAQVGESIVRFVDAEDCVIDALGADWSSLFNTMYVTNAIGCESNGNTFYGYKTRTVESQLYGTYTASILQGVGDPMTPVCFPGLVSVYDSSTAYVIDTTLLDGNGNILYQASNTQPLSAVDAIAESIKIVDNHIYVSGADDTTQVQVVDTCGRQVLEARGEACSDISLSALNRGIYVISIVTRNSRQVTKFAL